MNHEFLYDDLIYFNINHYMQLLPELGDVFVLEASSFRLGLHHKLDLAEVGVQHLKTRKQTVKSIYF